MSSRKGPQREQMGYGGAEKEEDEHGGRRCRGESSGPQEGWRASPGTGVKHRRPGGVRKERLGVSVCTPQASCPKSLGPQIRPPTSVAKNPLGRCLPRDARPPAAGLSLALMVC